MIQKKVRILGMLSAMLCCGAVSAQQHEVEMIPFGNMDQWNTYEKEFKYKS